MCGLVGMAGLLSVKDENVLRNLLVFDTVRGVDSTGVAVVSRDCEVKVAKALGNAFNLIDSLAFDQCMKGINKIFIGHNRYATQGKVSPKNAHPYEIGDIVGAHNGTLKNKYSFVNGNKYDVDSQALYDHINERGIEDAVRIADGAYALTWYNQADDTLNFIRNEERPLFIAIDKKEERIFWASERWMLSVALSRNDIEAKEISELPVDTHLSFSFSKQGGLEKPHAKEVKQPPKPVYFSGKSQVALPGNLTVIGTKPAENPFQAGIDYTFEIVGSGIDMNKNNYYIAKSRLFNDIRCRLYRHKSDRVELMSKFVRAKLHPSVFTDPLGTYIKLEHSSVAIVDDISAATKAVVEDSTSGEYHYDASGRLVSLVDWNKKHGTCSWCTGHVNPKLNFKFTDSGDVLCHSCADDKEVLTYVNVR
jgi:predicted glutamine amidotransferase